MSAPELVAPSRNLPRDSAWRLLVSRDDGMGFRRLLGSRLGAQAGDGMFQAALTGAVLFNPERAAEPMTIAAGLAVLLLPYSLVGPFAGALLDRWDRRRVLVTANLLRGALIVVVAAAVGGGVGQWPLLAGVLVVTAISRFVLAGLSTALPHVVAREQLVQTNALSVTLGTVAAVLGGGAAIVARTLVGTGNTGSALVMALAVLGSLAAAAVAAGFARYRLGPDDGEEAAESVAAVARGLVDGMRAAARVRSVTAGLLALGAHRLCFGATVLAVLLLYRYTFSPDGLLRAGLPGAGQALLAGGAGILLAALITGPLTRRVGRRAAVRGALVLAALVAVVFGLPMLKWTTLVLVFGLALTGQVVKLSLDATVQRDITDEVRGRVFALYDAVFNVAWVLAAGLGALVVPLDGRAPDLLLATTVVYLAGAAAHVAADRRSGARTVTAPGSGMS